MSSSAPVPPAPEFVMAQEVKAVARPPYVAVPHITNPKLAAIPALESFLELCPGEKLVKQWRVRVRRPKFPWLSLLASMAFMIILLAPFWAWYLKERRYAINAYEASTLTGRTSVIEETMPTHSAAEMTHALAAPSAVEDFKANDAAREFVPEPAPDFPGARPYDAAPPIESPSTPDSLNGPGSPPLLNGPGHPPSLDSLKTVRYEGPPRAVAAPSPPLAAASLMSGVLFFFLIWLALPVLVVVSFFLFALRGHTFLYLTNRRLIVVELEQNIFSRNQTVLNYSLENISGFTLHAQRGLKKLLNLILLKEKRTFYMAIVTRTLAQFALGAVNTFRSRYEPGLDAVAVCSELDALVLSLKAGSMPQ